jgi:triosephosphate isomerase (TIM)
MRKTVIIGNWKLNKTTKETLAFARDLRQNLRSVPENVTAGISPTHLSLCGALEEMKGSGIKVGAQNGYWEENGAYTGQVSMHMLKDAGADFCLVGHSEQRQFFGETDETVNKKTKIALELGLLPVVCIGESLEERENAKTNDVLAQQLKEGLKDLNISSADDIIVAYEPVWAIGTGKTATPEMAEEAHAFVRKTLAEIFSAELANAIVIQYGGSAKPANARELLDCENIDGLLVGGASLEVESFCAIINS